MIYYHRREKLVQKYEFPMEILVTRNCWKEKIKELKELYPKALHCPIGKFAERLHLKCGDYEKKLFEQVDCEAFHSEEPYTWWNYKWEPLPFVSERPRCFLAQDVLRRKKRQRRVQELLERFRDSIVVKMHPVQRGYPEERQWWKDVCDPLGIPLLDFPPPLIAQYPQTISLYSTAYRWAPGSDNIVLHERAYLPRFCGVRFAQTLEEIEPIREISEQEQQWRMTRFSWLCTRVLLRRKGELDDHEFEKVKCVLQFHYFGEPLV